MPQFVQRALGMGKTLQQFVQRAPDMEKAVPQFVQRAPGGVQLIFCVRGLARQSAISAARLCLRQADHASSRLPRASAQASACASAPRVLRQAAHRMLRLTRRCPWIAMHRVMHRPHRLLRLRRPRLR